jgi:hypothetical protein
MSRYASKEDLQCKADNEGGAAEFIFGYGLAPEDLPDGTPAEVSEALSRITADQSKDFETFTNWLWDTGDNPEVREPAGVS